MHLVPVSDMTSLPSRPAIQGRIARIGATVP
jgi:hypothetical protein